LTGKNCPKNKGKMKTFAGQQKFGKLSPEEVLKYVLTRGKYTRTSKKMQKKVKI
jgi:hypothetical protein